MDGQASGTSADLYAFHSRYEPWERRGERATIIHTADGGRTWSEQHAGDFSVGLSVYPSPIPIRNSVVSR